MSVFFTAINTSEGLVHVVTKTHWLGLLKMPHTSVMPQGAADLRRSGSFIKWTTTDAAVLAKLHEAIVALASEGGPSGLVKIGNSVKMTERLASAVGGDWHDIIKQASKDGVPLPIPDEVLMHVKSFT
jgi:hypothetical protein